MHASIDVYTYIRDVSVYIGSGNLHCQGVGRVTTWGGDELGSATASLLYRAEQAVTRCLALFRLVGNPKP